MEKKSIADEYAIIVANNLKKLMKDRNVARDKLAKDLDIGYSTLSNWLLGYNAPKMDKVQALAEYFGVNYTDIISNSTSNFEPYDLEEYTVKIPILGVIPAGTPMEAIEDIIDYIEIPKEWTRGGKEFFALKLKGDSMFPKYNDGDVVIFKKTPDCNSGDEVCVLVNGNDATFKRLLKYDSGITLQPLNTAYDIKMYSNKDIKNLPIRVLGVAVEMRRKV